MTTIGFRTQTVFSTQGPRAHNAHEADLSSRWGASLQKSSPQDFGLTAPSIRITTNQTFPLCMRANAVHDFAQVDDDCAYDNAI
jgi:hypothetical protein